MFRGRLVKISPFGQTTLSSSLQLAFMHMLVFTARRVPAGRGRCRLLESSLCQETLTLRLLFLPAGASLTRDLPRSAQPLGIRVKQTRCTTSWALTSAIGQTCVGFQESEGSYRGSPLHLAGTLQKVGSSAVSARSLHQIRYDFRTCIVFGAKATQQHGQTSAKQSAPK
jgi:hypothetical protein